MLLFRAEIAVGVMESCRHGGTAVCKVKESTLINANILVMVNSDVSNSNVQRTAGTRTPSRTQNEKDSE